MLSGCHAHIIAQTPAQNRSLIKLAQRVGFSSVATVTGEGVAPVESTMRDLLFFLVHHRLTDATMHSIINQLRASEDDAIRFAPIVLIIDDCPFETVLKYIEFGYDDVVTLPEKREVLVARLTSQLSTDHVYVETSDYLGPDRRRMDLGPGSVAQRREAEAPHTRLIIHRSPDNGVEVRRREFMGHSAKPAQESARRTGARA